MGHIRFPIRNFFNETSELIGIKSGLLLNRSNISTILLEEFQDDFLKTDNLDSIIRLDSVDVENMLLYIRQRIGNLPQVLPSTDAYGYLRNYFDRTGDLSVLTSASSIGLYHIRKNENISLDELILAINHSEGYDLDLSRAIAIISLERADLSCVFPATRDWNQATDLSNLFDCELNSENQFLEQKFIDYLAINGHEIEKIHWRNFERFCAEYFRRQGYVVILGPGTNDGGVDIRVFKENNDKAPQFIIQCKRYKLQNKVSIETVKSFYTDVQFENAEAGIIATTSYIADGGKKVSMARGYNLRFEEIENVKKWAREMWDYK